MVESQPDSPLDPLEEDAPLDEVVVAETTSQPLPAGGSPDVLFAAVESGPEGRGGRRLGLGAWLAIGWLVLVVGSAILAPVLPLADPNATIDNGAIAREGPFSRDGAAEGRPLGGDANSRDMLSRLVWGGRASMGIAVGAVAFGFVVGGVLGLNAGYFGGRLDTLLSGMFDVFLSIPAVILAVSLTAILGQEIPYIVLAIGIVSIPILGRITRASTLAWSQREFVLAAKAQGAKHLRIMVREILPNVLPAMLSIALLGVAVAIVAEGGLSILGAGVKPPTPSWGNTIAIGRADLQGAPHIVFEPALVIFLTVLSLNFMGDVVRARFDVREAGI